MVTALRFDLRTKQISQFTFLPPASTVSAAGSAAGIASASATASGPGRVSAVGTSAGAATATASGIRLGTVSGVGVAAGEALVYGRATSSAVVDAVGASFGAATATAAGRAVTIAQGAGTSAGAASVSAAWTGGDPLWSKVALFVSADLTDGSEPVDVSNFRTPLTTVGPGPHIRDKHAQHPRTWARVSHGMVATDQGGAGTYDARVNAIFVGGGVIPSNLRLGSQDWALEFVVSQPYVDGMFYPNTTTKETVVFQMGRTVAAYSGTETVFSRTGMYINYGTLGVELYDGDTLLLRRSVYDGTARPSHHVLVECVSGNVRMHVNGKRARNPGLGQELEWPAGFVSSLTPNNYLTLGGERIEYPDGSVRWGDDFIKRELLYTAHWRITVGDYRRKPPTYAEDLDNVPSLPFPRS